MSSSLASLPGNRACALGALAAGCRFFAGYPITPSSEIAEQLSRELPRVDGVFIQMEDEIGSLAAVIGASLGGAKAMTATSGPGFSLMQENLGYAAMTETPCVIVNVMRGGPSTGMPTRPAQGDIMQARWGTHGDHPIIVVTPASVQEIYMETIRAFNLAEEFRTPVVVLYDETVAHLIESVETSGRADDRDRGSKMGGRNGARVRALRRDRRSRAVHAAAGRRSARACHRPHPHGRRLSHAETRARLARAAAHPRQDRTSSRADRKLRDAGDGGRRRRHRRHRHRRARRAPRGAGSARRRDQGRPVAPGHAVAVPRSRGARRGGRARAASSCRR